MDQMRYYLSRVAPLVGGQYIGIHRRWVSEDPKKKPSFPGTACKTINEACEQARYWAHERRTDVYLSQGNQKDHAGMPIKSFLPRALRKQYNVTALKSLYLDVDLKDYNAVEDMDEALEHLYTFIPKPSLIVNSGRGRHLYWVCQDLLHPDNHRTFSHALINCAMDSGLKFDYGCSSDICRLLRVPDTYNFKMGNPLPVTLDEQSLGDDFSFDDITNFLAPWLNTTIDIPGSSPGTKGEDLSLEIDLGDDEDEDDLGGGIRGYTNTKADLQLVRKECAFVDNALNTAGKDHREPLWKVCITLAHYTLDPEQAVIDLSSGHHSFSPSETVEKLKQVERDRQSNPSLGPHKCKAIFEAGATECRTCVHFQHNTTPLSFGYAKVNGNYYSGAPQSNITPDLPTGYYRRTTDSCICKLVTGDDGETEAEVFPYPIIQGSAFMQAGSPGYFLAFSTLEAKNKKEVLVDTSVLPDKMALAKALSKQGIFVPASNQVKEFMTSFSKMLQHEEQTLVAVPAMGWHQYKNCWGFSYDGVFYSRDFNLRAHSLSSNFGHYRKRGDTTCWNTLSSIVVNPSRPDLSVLAASGFAAPLLHFVGQNGFILGAYSANSGLGKTTALSLSQAIWGSPDAMCGLSDTLNHIFSKASHIQCLPVIYDEIKGEKDISNFLSTIFQITSGREKGRSNRSGEARETRTWTTELVYATNASMIAEIEQRMRGSYATIYRDFEFEAKPNISTSHSSSDVARMVTALKVNYGSIGAIYAEFLGKNYDTIKEIIQSTQLEFEKEFNVLQEERFWVAAIITHMMGAHFAGPEVLNLAPFDYWSIRDFLIEEFQRMRKLKTTSLVDYENIDTVINDLTGFLRKHRRDQTVVTDTMVMSAGKPTKGSVKILNDHPGLIKGGIVAHISLTPLMLRFSDAVFGEYCKSLNLPKASIIKGMQTKFNATYATARLASGTKYSETSEKCWTISLTGTELEDAVEWTMQYQ